MKLIEHLTNVISEDLKEVFEKEEKNSDYLNQKEFQSSLQRAEKGINDATKRARNILALAIANHRSKEHGDINDAEINYLSSVVSEEDQKVALQSWWKA